MLYNVYSENCCLFQLHNEKYYIQKLQSPCYAEDIANSQCKYPIGHFVVTVV